MNSGGHDGGSRLPHEFTDRDRSILPWNADRVTSVLHRLPNVPKGVEHEVLQGPQARPVVVWYFSYSQQARDLNFVQ